MNMNSSSPKKKQIKQKNTSSSSGSGNRFIFEGTNEEKKLIQEKAESLERKLIDEEFKK